MKAINRIRRVRHQPRRRKAPVKKKRGNEFKPDWVSPPADTIKDLMMVRAEEDLALWMHKPFPFIQRLLQGKERITPKVAAKLTFALGGTTKFWLNRERQYRAGLKRLKEGK